MTTIVRKPLGETPRCATCEASNDVSRCAGCTHMWYCSRQHQVSNWSQHKPLCNAVKKSRKLFDDEEQRLREMPSSMFFQSNPFENGVGRFWGIQETRDYMRARFALVENLLRLQTVTAVQAADEHAEDMLRLCRSDNVGIRSYIPSMLLRLGRYQHCYDFVKWWAIISTNGRYDWGNPDLPYLDIRNADMLEPCETFLEHAELSHMVSLTLLKIKLWLELDSLRASIPTLSTKLPTEIAEMVVSMTTDHDCIGQVARRANFGPTMQQLKTDVNLIYRTLHEKNKYFWPALLAPGRHLTANPAYTSAGSQSEMQVTLQQTYHSWIESPGAIDIIQCLRREGTVES